jgi:hypothetical protein
MTPVQAIRKKCLDCCCGSAHEVKACQLIACTLHPFRLGRNPNRKGVSNLKSAQSSGRFVSRKPEAV